MAGIADIFNGGRIVDHEGKEVDIKQRFAGKTVGIYFSAHWCPPCRGFTPVLSEFFKKHNAGKKFEVIFVSSDRDDKSFNEYFGEMPWVALQFADRTLKTELCNKYGVRGIPSLIILNGDNGEVISDDGRSSVTDDPEGVFLTA